LTDYEKFDIKKEVKEMGKERTNIKKIEKLEFLGAEERMNLILTYLGEKPTSLIEMIYDSGNPLADLKEVLSQKENLEKLLAAFGLKFKTLEKERIDEEGFDIKEFRIFIGRREKDVEELEKAFLAGDEEKVGRLLGYPESAVRGFVKGKVLEEKEWWQGLSEKERRDLISEGVLNFKNFKFSKENWREELDTVRRRQGIIKKIAPNLYQEMMKRRPEWTMNKVEREEYLKKTSEEILQGIRKRVEKKFNNLKIKVKPEFKETIVMLIAFRLRVSKFCEGCIRTDKTFTPWVEICSRISEIEDWKRDKILKEKLKRQNLFYLKRIRMLLNLFYRKRKVSSDRMLKIEFTEIPYGFRIQSKSKEEMEEFTKFLREIFPKYMFRPLR
jgi:hypothetical protein